MTDILEEIYLTKNSLGNSIPEWGCKEDGDAKYIRADLVAGSDNPASKTLIWRTKDTDGQEVVVVAGWFYDASRDSNEYLLDKVDSQDEALKTAREALESALDLRDALQIVGVWPEGLKINNITEALTAINNALGGE